MLNKDTEIESAVKSVLLVFASIVIVFTVSAAAIYQHKLDKEITAKVSAERALEVYQDIVRYRLNQCHMLEQDPRIQSDMAKKLKGIY